MNEMFDKAPIMVRWNGWESSTYQLKASGWEVWAGEKLADFHHAKIIDIALTTPRKELMLAGRLKLNYRDVVADPRGFSHALSIGVECQLYRINDRVMVIQEPHRDWAKGMESLEPVDGLLYRPIGDSDYIDVRSFKHMRREEEGRPIFIDRASVDDCLNRILQVQYPTQKVLKELGQQATPIMHAKIYSIAA